MARKRFGKFQEFIDNIGLISITNDCGEKRKCFKNGFIPSILESGDGNEWSVACFDCNGYLMYSSKKEIPDIPELKDGSVMCYTEQEVETLINKISKTIGYVR